MARQARRSRPIENELRPLDEIDESNLEQVDLNDIDDLVEQRAQQIAQTVLRENARSKRRNLNGNIFSRFEPNSDVVENQKEIVTEGIFSNGVGTLLNFYTSSTQTVTQKQYYYEIFNSASDAPTAEPQFSVVWGHRNGSGSDASGTLNDSPTRAIYSQYRLLLLEPDDTTFTFANNTNSDSIYAINFNRARYKEKLDPGNFEIHLQGLSGSSFANNVHTGSNVTASAGETIISLIDDSGDAQQNLSKIGKVSEIYNVLSGSITGGIYKDANDLPVYYGLVYPKQGIVILNGDSLDASASFNTVTGSDINGDNAYKLFTSIKEAANLGGSEKGFVARNAETVTSTHYFARLKNGEYNFSNNPTFITGSVGEFNQPTFIGDPKTYVTTVGLYNDRQELLAVAKTSQPIQKSFVKESVIRIKLDF